MEFNFEILEVSVDNTDSIYEKYRHSDITIIETNDIIDIQIEYTDIITQNNRIIYDNVYQIEENTLENQFMSKNITEELIQTQIIEITEIPTFIRTCRLSYDKYLKHPYIFIILAFTLLFFLVSRTFTKPKSKKYTLESLHKQFANLKKDDFEISILNIKMLNDATQLLSSQSQQYLSSREGLKYFEMFDECLDKYFIETFKTTDNFIYNYNLTICLYDDILELLCTLLYISEKQFEKDELFRRGILKQQNKLIETATSNDKVGMLLFYNIV